jgi:hypothetical protein
MAVTETPTTETFDDELTAPPVTTVADYMGCPSLDLHDGMVQMLAVKHATDAELAKMAAAAQARDLHSADGATGMGPWLAMAGGLTTANAQAYVTVGRALANLPHLAAAFSDGRLSLDQVKPAVRFVTPETDEEMAGRLPGWSARQIEEAAREARVRTPKDANEAHANRNLRCVDDDEAGGGHLHAFLPAEQYATTRAELLRRAEQAGPDAETGMWEPLGARMADALFEAMGAAGADRDPQDPAVVVHVDAEVADGLVAGNGTIDGLTIPVESVLRFLCACKVLEFAVEADDGTKTVGIGRLSRKIPRWLRRIILNRDTACRFPGCDRAVQHVHHLTHWHPAHKGKTDDDNLIGLCWAHHRLVHEGGWKTRGDPRHEITFLGPDGQELHSRPQGLRTEVRRRLFDQRRG